jgi:transposase
MPNPILLPENFSSYDFKEMSKKEPHPANRIRLIAMANIQENKTLESIAKTLQVHWKTVQNWLSNFRKKGIAGLYVKPKPGAPKKLNSTVEEWINKFIYALNADTTGGHITGKQLQALVEKEFSISCSLRTIYNTLHRLKFSWITARSIHPKSDLEIQALYKKLSNTTPRIDT